MSYELLLPQHHGHQHHQGSVYFHLYAHVWYIRCQSVDSVMSVICIIGSYLYPSEARVNYYTINTVVVVRLHSYPGKGYG